MSTPLVVPLDSFPSLLARTWTWLRRGAYAALGLAAFVVVSEIARMLDLLARVHPALAWVVGLGVGLPLLGWTAWRAWRYLRTPRVVAPPRLPPPSTGWSEAHRRRYREFAVRYLRRQSANPRLPESARTGIPAAIEQVLVPLADDVAADPIRAAHALRERVAAAIDPVLEPLDREAKRLIRRASVEVAVATAVSPSVLMDTLITLTRNVDLMSRLADLYYGRPGLAGTVRIVRDVLGSAVAAGALEIVSDHVTSALSEMAGSWSTRLLGPIGQGMINGIVTMRLGASARQRCRALEARRPQWRPWSLGEYRRAGAKLKDWLVEDIGPGVKQPLTWFMARARGDEGEGEATWDGARPRRRWWSRVFGGRRRQGPAEPEAGAAAEETPTAEREAEVEGDPLLDSDLMR